MSAPRERLFEHLRRVASDPRVTAAMERTPRERFVPPELAPWAWENRPLPIGNDQTISQPEIVAAMTEALLLRGDEKVLEVGTGSGYQAAVLSALAREVVTVERFPSLAEQAAAVLAELGRANVRVYVAGPTLGWPDEAPYDAIIVTAGAPSVPEALVAQLAPGGRLVLPVGSRYEQELTRVTLLADGSPYTERLGPCRFVPLVGEGAWPNDDHPDLV